MRRRSKNGLLWFIFRMTTEQIMLFLLQPPVETEQSLPRSIFISLHAICRLVGSIAIMKEGFRLVLSLILNKATNRAGLLHAPQLSRNELTNTHMLPPTCASSLVRDESSPGESWNSSLGCHNHLRRAGRDQEEMHYCLLYHHEALDVCSHQRKEQ